MPEVRRILGAGAPARVLLAALLSLLALALAGACHSPAAAAAPTRAQARPAAPGAEEVEVEVEAEDEEGEEEAEGGEGSEEEGEEEAEGGEAEGAGGGGEAARCGLLRVEGEAVAAGDRLRLTLRYSTAGGGSATIEYSARGPHGSLDSGSARRALGRSGTLELSRRLSPGQARRVQAARSFLVRVELSGDAARCAAVDRLLVSSVDGGRGPRSWSERHRRG